MVAATSPDFGVATMAQRRPETVAIDLDGEQVTYRQLDAMANGLARCLLEEAADDQGGTTPGTGAGELISQTCVPVMVEGTKELVVATEAVRRAGMIAVPVDPNTPDRRIQLIVEKVNAPFVVSDSEAPMLGGVPRIHPLHDALDGDSPVNRPLGPVGMIVFTSGSTGEPKGVLKVPARPEGILPMIASIFGDEVVRVGVVVAGSVAAMLPMVDLFAACGWTLVPFEIRHHPGSPAAWVRRAGVKVFAAVPTILRQVVAQLGADEIVPGLQYVGIFGESMMWEDIGKLRPHLPAGHVVFNVYAQSEAGDISLMAIGEDTPLGKGRVPIGSPLPGREVWIEDPDGNRLPTGEVGQLVVRSAPSALGYLGEDPARSRVFFPQPDGTMVVKTGDLGRLREDGTLEHLGRMDDMVKISGNRVDLGEIESLLRTYPWVTDVSATTYINNQGDLRIRAYVQLQPSRIANPRVMRGWLVQRLPRYAVPDVIEQVEELSRLPNGKVDRKSLANAKLKVQTTPPAPSAIFSGETTRLGHEAITEQAQPLVPGANAGSEGDAYVPRASSPLPVLGLSLEELEGQLLTLWKDILALEDLGVDDNFFESGGDSLLAVELVAAMSAQLQAEVPIAALIDHATVRSLAMALAGGSTEQPVVVINEKGPGIPIFVLHDGFGSLFGARRYLDAIELDQPVFGLSAPAWDKSAPVDQTLGSLAARHVATICETFPRGSVGILGWATGCLIAFEVARQLQEQGRSVGLLMLGSDTNPPEPARAVFQRAWQATRTAPLREFPSVAIQVAVQGARYSQKFARYRKLVTTSRANLAARGETMEIPQAKRPELAFEYHRDLILSYRPPGRFHGPTVVIRAPWVELSSVERWRHWLDGPLRFADPDTLLQELKQSPVRTAEHLAP